MNHQPDINKIYLDEKDPSEAKYQFLINKSETVGSNYCSDSSFYWILKWYARCPKNIEE